MYKSKTSSTRHKELTLPVVIMQSRKEVSMLIYLSLQLAWTFIANASILSALTIGAISPRFVSAICSFNLRRRWRKTIAPAIPRHTALRQVAYLHINKRPRSFVGLERGQDNITHPDEATAELWSVRNRPGHKRYHQTKHFTQNIVCSDSDGTNF